MLALALTSVVGCGALEDTGRIAFAAAFPAPKLATQGFRAQIIPDGTTKIVVRVTGERIPVGTVMSATMTPTKPSVLFKGVPIGAKTITARAMDENDAVMAQGETMVTIIAGRTVEARLKMDMTSEDGRFVLILQ